MIGKILVADVGLSGTEPLNAPSLMAGCCSTMRSLSLPILGMTPFSSVSARQMPVRGAFGWGNAAA